VRKLKLVIVFASLAVCRPQAPVQNETFEGFPAVVLSTSKLGVTVMTKGSTLASLTLNDDSEKLSPLWNPMRMARELGRPVTFDGGAGHFVCVDGFGPASAEERAAGLPFHGEAHTETFAVYSERHGSSVAVTLTATLPIVHEVFTRTFRVIDGENVVHVESELESLLGFDRPVNWAEHATIGSPFLEAGVTVVDVSGSRSRTRPYTSVENGDVQRRLKPDQDFSWPLAPGLDGKMVDLRQTPEHPHFLDHAATLLYPDSQLGWATAINPKKQLILGYVQEGRLSLAPILGELPSNPENGPRNGIQHSAFRRATSRGRHSRNDVWCTDLSLAFREIKNQDSVFDFLRPHTRRFQQG
jgi:hypothetical protein